MAAVSVQEAVAPCHRQIAVDQESIARMELLGELLALRVGIGADRQDLDALVTELGQDGSKTLELGDAEGSPVAAIEDQDDRRPLAERREAHGRS